MKAHFHDLEHEEEPFPDMDAYDAVIIGCSVHDGHIQPAVRNCITAHCQPDSSSIRALYCCALKGADSTRQVLRTDIPYHILDSFAIAEPFGGQIYKQKLSFLERRILKQISFEESQLITLNDVKVRKFAINFQQAYLEFSRKREYAEKHRDRVHYKAKQGR